MGGIWGSVAGALLNTAVASIGLGWIGKHNLGNLGRKGGLEGIGAAGCADWTAGSTVQHQPRAAPAAAPSAPQRPPPHLDPSGARGQAALGRSIAHPHAPPTPRTYPATPPPRAKGPTTSRLFPDYLIREKGTSMWPCRCQ